LILSGVPILQSCEILKNTQHNMLLKQMIAHFQTDIESGHAITETFKKYPEHFDEFTCELLQIGIHSGTFALMLNRVAIYKEKKLWLHKKIKQALFYPMIVVSFALFVSVIMLIFVVPRFAEIFLEMNKSLPVLTQWVINISQLLCRYGFILFIPFFALFLFWDVLKNSHEIQENMEYFFLKFTIFQKIKLIHFARNLMITLNSGIPILDALKFTTGSFFYKKASKKIQKDIVAGYPLHLAMQKIPHFPAFCVQMVKIGEESGSLEQMLEKVVELYESDIDHFVANLGQVLEPLIMVVLGVLIGGLVIAMYLPIFKLGTTL
jgi:type IV pilus assembly protein PilC